MFDFAVIGAGIAGASLAAEIALFASVVLIEAEEQPGYHATGRSAAFWHETLGGPQVQPLTTASYATLNDGGFLTPRESLNVAQAADVHLLEALDRRFGGTGVRLRRIGQEEVRRRIPRATDLLIAGLVEESCADIDVAALHAMYLGAVRRAGGVLETAFRVAAISRTAEHWRIDAGDRAIEAKVIVNAAGAWGDVVAKLAGAMPVGMQPRRRTIAQVRVDGDDVPADLPLVMDIAGSFYFKPEGPNKLWLCPHDETPVEPGDAAPEEIDVAIAIERFETVTNWKVLAVERKWAGLRTFAPDRLPVYGRDTQLPDFFWCAGQGGYGIQTAPAAARMAAAMLLGHAPDASVKAIDPASFAPGRFLTSS